MYLISAAGLGEINFGDLKKSFMHYVHADATAFIHLTLLVPLSQFTIVSEPSWFLVGFWWDLDVGLALVCIVYI